MLLLLRRLLLLLRLRLRLLLLLPLLLLPPLLLPLLLLLQACHRVRDASSAGDVAGAQWDVVTIDADSGKVASAVPLAWPAQGTEDVLGCLAGAQ